MAGTAPTRYRYDVFLSHSSADKPVVRELAAQLRAAGLRVWFDNGPPPGIKPITRAPNDPTAWSWGTRLSPRRGLEPEQRPCV
jgi:hypothetical protein